jgi:hypothetical protein
MFSIGFTDEPVTKIEPEDDGQVGLLVLGNHKEHFVAHMSIWSEKDYVEHWKAALARALAGKRSALITDMLTPMESSHLVWWPVWKVDNTLFFHNQLLFFDQHKIYSPQINLCKLYKLIGDRRSEDDDGTALSEWCIPVSEVEEFLATPSTEK